MPLSLEARQQMNIEQALGQLAADFSTHSDSPRLDAELLLCRVLDRPRSYLYTWPERELNSEQQAQLESLAERRRRGEPIAHILGEREFWSLPLKISSATLIPRPETELLVETALAHIQPGHPATIADLGTGSGAIALALASERPLSRIVAVEQSPEALAIAQANARQLGLDNIVFRHGSWFAPLNGQRFDLILSNPPYLREDDPHLQQGDVRHEPRTALVSGADGLDDLRTIIRQAPAHLLPGGWLILEHGYDQGAAVAALLQAAGFSEVAELKDLQGHDRVGIGRWMPEVGV